MSEKPRRVAGGAAPGPPAPLEHRESFRVAQAVLTVLRRRCPRWRDEDAVWQAFVAWRGHGEADYLTSIRAGGRYIFYAILQDLYDFAEESCHEDLSESVGEHLAQALLDHHMPDILQTTLIPEGDLAEQILSLVNQMIGATTGEVYELKATRRRSGGGLGLALGYRSPAAMADYLRRSGHRPERAFARSFAVFRGALRTLLARAIHGFTPAQLTSDERPLQGRFVLTLTSENRFHYENMIEMLTGYVRQLRERVQPGRAADEDAPVHVSPAMQAAWARLRAAADSEETVLLSGESGTGKSYYARRIHDLGPRRSGPFVEVGLTADVGSDNLIQSNLFGHVRGAFTGADAEKQGLFALAAGGSIFLDEVGDASPELQAKLLRVIEGKRFKMLGGVEDVAVDVRIIAATNRDLTAMVAGGRFREDLYYRLNVISILLPPLRSRPEDLPALIERLFDKVRHETREPGKRLSESALDCLCAYRWPGNIRELENALRHAVAFSTGDEVGPDALPETVRESADSMPGLTAQPGANRPMLSPDSRAPRSEASAKVVIDRAGLRRALSTAPPPAGTPTFEWPGHIDHARREYLRVLIDHYAGNLRAIAAHWDRSSENTILKTIRAFGLEEALRAARDARP